MSLLSQAILLRLAKEVPQFSVKTDLFLPILDQILGTVEALFKTFEPHIVDIVVDELRKLTHSDYKREPSDG